MIKRILMTAMVLGGLCGVSLYANTFVGGVENNPSNADPTEGVGDFNDMLFQLSATGLQLVSSNGTWQSPFNSGVVNESGASVGNPFWDNRSLDGSQKNIGYCLTTYGTTNNCGLTSAPAGVTQYLTATGNQGAPPTDFYFTFGGGPIGSVLLGAVTPNASNESLGIYDLSNGNNIQWLILNGAVNGAVVSGGTFTPNWSSFGLIFQIQTSPGVSNYYYSQDSLPQIVGNAVGSVPDNRFAMFQLPDAVPEPGTMALLGFGALALGILPRLRKYRR